MVYYVLRRILQGVVMIWLMSVVAFLAIYALGNPISALINPNSPPEVVAAVVRDLGLDLPFHQQYLRFLGNLLQGDFGRSYITSQPALSLILDRFPATLELTVAAMTLAAIFGIPLGIIAGYRPHSLSGHVVSLFSMTLLSLPSFWTALVLIILFSIEMSLLPTGGRGEIGTVLGISSSLFTLDGLRHIILPAINLSLFPLAMSARLTAAGVRETMSTPFIKFARAKGMTTRSILFRYVLRNIMVPIVTVIGIVFGILLAFTVVTESIFAWPGTGRLIIDSIRSSDRPVIIAYLMFTVTLFIVINFAVDVLCALIDPRISLDGRKG